MEDPYIRAKFQVHNFVRFCELILSSCKRLKQVRLTTGPDSSHKNTEVSDEH